LRCMSAGWPDVTSHGMARGSLTTKIAALVDTLGNLARFVLLPRRQHGGDITSFEALLAGIACLALIGDKAFDAHRLRERLAGKGIGIDRDTG
jgi:hypothetical protein